MKKIFDRLERLVRNPWYTVPVCLSAVAAYLFQWTHISVGLDTLSTRYMEGGELIAQGRFIGQLVNLLLPYDSVFLVQNIFSTLLLIVAGTLFCVAFLMQCEAAGEVEGRSVLPYALFCCLFVTNPLIAEEYIFKSAGFAVSSCLMLCSLAVLVVAQKVQHSVVIATALIFVICGWHEGSIPVYICAVFGLLYYRERVNGTSYSLKMTIYEGLRFIPPLIAGFALKLIVSKLLQFTLNAGWEVASANQFYWMQNGLIGSIGLLIKGFLYDYVLKIGTHFPITVLALAVVILTVDSIHAQAAHVSRHSFALALGMLGSLALLSVVRGLVLPYRSSQTIYFFVAYVGMLFCLRRRREHAEDQNARLGVRAFAVCLLVVAQVFSLNYWFETNQIRSDEEERTLSGIATTVISEYGDDIPVVFTGYYSGPDFIQDRLYIPSDNWWVCALNSISSIDSLPSYTEKHWYPLSQSIGESGITWGIYAYGGQTELFQIISYLGFDLKQGDSAMVADANSKTIESESPYVIINRGNYIQVHFTGHPFFWYGLHKGTGVM